MCREVNEYLFLVGTSEELDWLHIDGAFLSLFAIFAGSSFLTAAPNAAECYQQDYQAHSCER